MKTIRYTAILLFGMAMMGCSLYEYEGDCGTHVRFAHTYNILGTDAFNMEAHEVDLYVFDKDGRFVDHKTQDLNETQDELIISDLEPGDYKFVAWASSKKTSSGEMSYDFSPVSADLTLADFSARVKRTDGVCANRFTNTLCGVKDVSITGRGQTETISLLKCNNNIRVILVPVNSTQKLDADSFDIRIDGQNGWLAYDASPFCLDPITYMPYFKEFSQSETKSSEVIDNAVIADFAVNRFICGTKPRLVVTNTTTETEIFDIDLIWFLTLQAIGEHRIEWSDQEYLDRQDEYTITFFINADNSTWLYNRIIVNGWVLSLDDTTLR